MKLMMIIKRRKGKALERENHNREKMRFRSSCIYGCRNYPKLLRKMKTLVQDLMSTEKKKVNWWRNVYDSCDDRFHVTRENFNFILNRIQPYNEEMPKNILPTPSQIRSVLTIYRFAKYFHHMQVNLLNKNWWLFSTGCIKQSFD